MTKEVLQEALELLAVATFITPKLQAKRTAVINAGLQALEQLAQQEPVYWQWRSKDQPWSLEYTFNSEVQVTTNDSERRALYTSPPAQRTWVGLTDEQIDRLWSQSLADTESETWLPLREFARAIEAAHGIKENT